MISIFHMSNYRYRALSVFICEIKGSILKCQFICEMLFHNKIHTWYQYFTYEISIYGNWIMWNFQFIYEITNFIYELKISYINLRFHMWFDFIYGNFICEIAISHIKFQFHIWNFNFIYENFHFIYENFHFIYEIGISYMKSYVKFSWGFTHELFTFPLELIHIQIKFLPKWYKRATRRHEESRKPFTPTVLCGFQQYQIPGDLWAVVQCPVPVHCLASKFPTPGNSVPSKLPGVSRGGWSLMELIHALELSKYYIIIYTSTTLSNIKKHNMYITVIFQTVSFWYYSVS